MPRRPRISSKRGRQELRNELRKLNKKVSNRKHYLDANYDIQLDLDTSSPKEITSWKEFDRYQKRITKKLNQVKPNPEDRYVTNSEGVKFLRSDIKKVERLEKRVNRQRDEDYNQIKNLPYKDPAGRTIGEVQQQRHLGNPKFSRFRHFKFDIDSFYSQNELKKYLDRLKKNNAPLGHTERDRLMKENYLKSFENVFNQTGNPEDVVLDERRMQVWNHIKNLSMDEFLELFFSETIVAFNYTYSKQEEESKLREIESVFGLEPPAESKFGKLGTRYTTMPKDWKLR